MNQNLLAQTKLRLTIFAGTALLAFAPAAQAIVVTYGGPPIAITNDINGLYVNVVTGATGSAIAPLNWDFNIYNNSAGLAFFARTGDTANAYVGLTSVVSALPIGTTIGPASVFTGNAGAGGVAGTAFQTTGTRYFGFRFTNEGATPTPTVHYGWGLLSTTSGLLAGAGFPATLISYAFETTPNLPIMIPIPEPNTYLLMALGLVAVGGVAARRRKAAAD